MRKVIHQSSDGTQFLTAEQCRAYELKTFASCFEGLQEKQVVAAFDLTDGALSDAFEKAGRVIAHNRRKSGELKRASRKPAGK